MMERPTNISSSDAMRWNNDVEPYAEEIHRTDEQFDKELIRMSGFMW